MNVPQKQVIFSNAIRTAAVSERFRILKHIERWHHDRANAAGRGEHDGYGGKLTLRDCSRHIAIRDSIRASLSASAING